MSVQNTSIFDKKYQSLASRIENQNIGQGDFSHVIVSPNNSLYPNNNNLKISHITTI